MCMQNTHTRTHTHIVQIQHRSGIGIFFFPRYMQTAAKMLNKQQ